MEKTARKDITDDFLVQQGQNLFSQSHQWRGQEISPQWVEDSDQYNSKFPPDVRSRSTVTRGRKKLFIGKTYSVVDRLLVDCMDAVFSDFEEIVSITAWKSIPWETRDIVTTLMNYRLDENPINFYAEAYEFFQDGLRNHLGIIKTYPTLVDGQFHPVMECVPFNDVFFHPSATWKNYFKYPIVHRMKKSLEELKDAGYKNLDQFNARSTPTESDEVELSRTDDSGSPFATVSMVEEMNQVYIYEVWDFLPIGEDGKVVSCSYILGGDETQPQFTCRSAEVNTLPYQHMGDRFNRPPFTVGFPLPESHSLKGKSVPQIMSGLQRELNAGRNQILEATSLALKKPTLVNKGAGIDVLALVNRTTSQVILGNDISPNAIREMEVSDPSPAAHARNEKIEHDIWDLTSIPPELQGNVATRERDTATGSNNRISNANKKIKKMIINMVKSGIIPALRLLLRLEQEYESDEFVALVTERKLGWGFANDGLPPVAIIQGDFDLKVNLSISKDQQINKWVMLYDRMNQQNAVTAQMLQAKVVNPKRVKFFDPFKIVERIMKVTGEPVTEDYLIEAESPPDEQGQNAPPGVANVMQGMQGGAEMGEENVQ